MSPIPPGLPGAITDRYVIDREAGRGGMATVYVADDLKHRRKVAIKVMLPELSAAIGRDRFLREIEIGARLVHPHILPLYDSGAAGELLYYVTPYIEGESLRARLDREKQLPLDVSLRLAREIASALGYAHDQGVVHRDIKPENILLADDMALVADFGIARVISAEAACATAETMPGALTSAGAMIGTPRYMAPEQAAGDEVDGRADLYALACVLYEMLAGQPPFTASSAGELMRQHLIAEARPVTEHRPAVPGAVATMIAKAMAKLPADRPPTAARFAEELAVAAAGGETPAAVAPGRAARIPNNIPKPRTRFVGRDTELAECARLLEETRLLTLTGVGGSGKTRLASRLAESLLEKFPDGVWFVDLAPLKESEHVALTAAAVAGAPESPGTSPLDALVAHLRAERALIVIDNCEHLLEASTTLVDRLIGACDDIKVIATSREALGVSGERPFALQPLAVPSASASDRGAIEAAESVRLFVDRARIFDPRFELTEKSAPVVGEICRRLDGIPLAIELAAARTKVLSPEQIHSKLDDRFRLLTGGSKSALPRHQTLRATIQWSYDQLSADEKKLFRALSVFAGGWTLRAAARITDAGADEFETVDTLARLVDKSLVTVEKARDGDARYRLLDTVRQFAQELLEGTGEADGARRRHLDEFIETAESAYDERIQHEERWAPLLEAEHDNLRAALEFARATDPEKYLQLSGALAWFWQVRSRFLEGRDHLQAALAMTLDEPPRPARARALWGAASVMSWQGDSNALLLMQRSLEMWRTIGDPSEVAIALEGVAYAMWHTGSDEESRDTFRECLRLQREIADPAMINRAMVGLAQLHVALGELAEARSLSHQISAYARSRNDRRSAHFAAHYLADCALIEGSCAGALGGYRESLRLAHALGDRVETCFEIQGVAMSLAGLGRGAEALRLLSAADAEFARMGADIHVRFWDELLERFGAAARASVPAEEADRARAEGRKLEFEEAVREASKA